MLAKGQMIAQLMEQFAPKYYAVPDDKIGLQIGTLQKDMKRILVSLDIVDEVVEEAIRNDVDLIIAHHAVIFRPLKNVRTDLPQGKLVEKLIKHDIAVYIAHTNLDVTEGGINDMMADAIGINERTHLEEIHTDHLKKLVVYVPQSHHNQVMQSIFSAGAGWIGDYSHCSFNIAGTGTFLPQEGTDPYIGQQGKLEKVEEIRIETIVPENVQKKVIQSMLKAHPYEEVAYDLYPMDLKGRSFGLGRVGELEKEITLEQLVQKVKNAFHVPMARVVGDLKRPIRKAAVLGGSGSKYVKYALFAGADVLITGDIDFHTAQDALAAGIAIIDPGHHVEKIMKKGIADYLQGKMNELSYETEVIPSSIDTEPFQFL